MAGKTDNKTGSKPPFIDGVVMDLSEVTHEEWLNHSKAVTTGPSWTLDGHYAAWYAMFTKVVRACPWGDPASVETYKKLPQFGGFEALIAMFEQVVEDERKKVRSKSTTP
jgi:hypothetical protein